MRLLRWWALVLIAGSCAVTSLATAQAPSTGAAESEGSPQGGSELLKKKASEHFERGVTLFRDGAYRAALIEFERAYETSPDYRLLYNQAQMRMLLQDYLGATRDYERYLVEGGDKVTGERRELVERELGILRGRVARIVIQSNRVNAKVYVDDVLLGETPLSTTTPLNVGRHRIYAETADGSTATVVVDLAAGELHEVNLELKAPAVKTVVVRDPAGRPKQEESKLLPLTFTIATGVVLVATVGVALAAGSAQDDLEKQTRKIPATPSAIRDARSKARGLSITTDVLGATAIALGATAVVLWTLGRRDRTDDSARAWKFDVGLASLGATRRF